MKVEGVEHLVDRTYRESGDYQWVRETLVNALEAGATRVDFDFEWQAIANIGVYRTCIIDNGRGMTETELRQFFNTFGSGSKPIGGVHENYGVGAKTSLLPWNGFGLLVLSWVEGNCSMIRLRRAEGGGYGLECFEDVEYDANGAANRILSTCVDPEGFEAFPFYGCDVARIKPDWLGDHGTMIVLLGEGPDSDTILGDPSRNEGRIHGVARYLNSRFWELPDGVEVRVRMLRTLDSENWPKTMNERSSTVLRVQGARHYCRYPDAAGQVEAEGLRLLQDGTKVHWLLWEGPRPKMSTYANVSSFAAILYRGELYDLRSDRFVYRYFGIQPKELRERLTLILEPPEMGKTYGVYPRTDRNSLLLKSGETAGRPLPMAEWGADFARQLPDEIRDALARLAEANPATISDPAWRSKLLGRFGKSWRAATLYAKPGGRFSLTPGLTAARQGRVFGQAGSNGDGPASRQAEEAAGGVFPGPIRAERRQVRGGLPDYRIVFEGNDFLAAWSPQDPMSPFGTVLLNANHPVMLAVVEEWAGCFPHVPRSEVEAIVHQVYGEVAVSKVAHSEHLKGILPKEVIEERLRSEEALTMALLGLMAEHSLIRVRRTTRFGAVRAA